MDRIERRRTLLRLRQHAPFDEAQRHLESAQRGRTARRVRAHLRRLEPLSVRTPRWSAPQGFLEDLALDLAVGEPRVSCRTVSLRPLAGRSPQEAWNFLLRVMGELAGPQAGRRPLMMVCERRGFQFAAEELLEAAHEDSPERVALLLHGAEHLPVEVLEDVTRLFSRYAEEARDGRRVGMLLAGSVDSPAFRDAYESPVELTDFGEAEAAAALFMRLGAADVNMVRRTVLLSGGVPAIVNALLQGLGPAEPEEAPAPRRGFQVSRVSAPTRRLPGDPEGLIRAIGPLGDELRACVSMALSEPRHAARFYRLADIGPQPEDPAEDGALVLAGLARRTRGPHGGSWVELRAPALAVLAG